MLSRVANSLYWMARYIERADNTARIVDVNQQLLLESRRLNDAQLTAFWMPVLESTGDHESFAALHPRARGSSVTEFLLFDTRNGNSLVSSVAQARENARMVRDQVPAEMWEELNRLFLFLRSNEAREMWSENPFQLLQNVRSSALQFVGISYASTPHNEGWHFLQTGKFIERADKTTRMLDIRHATLPARGLPASISQADALGWAAVLRSCSAWDAYKALHGSEVHPRLVAEYLLLNDEFPRSLRFCVERVDASLHSISGVAARRFGNEAEKLSGRLLAEIQFSSIDDVFETGLHEYLDRVQIKLNAIGDSLFRAYIFQPFVNIEDEIMVQQEYQQQQPSGQRR
ncbi:MAG: alpha-E domain-containing protein [Verrucomicrobiota bacterium]